MLVRFIKPAPAASSSPSGGRKRLRAATALTMLNSGGSLKIKGPGPRAGSSVDKAALRAAQKQTNCIVNDAKYACYAIYWLLCRAKCGFVDGRSSPGPWPLNSLNKSMD